MDWRTGTCLSSVTHSRKSWGAQRSLRQSRPSSWNSQTQMVSIESHWQWFGLIRWLIPCIERKEFVSELTLLENLRTALQNDYEKDLRKMKKRAQSWFLSCKHAVRPRSYLILWTMWYPGRSLECPYFLLIVMHILRRKTFGERFSLAIPGVISSQSADMAFSHLSTRRYCWNVIYTTPVWNQTQRSDSALTG